jgi:hypothetical protein
MGSKYNFLSCIFRYSTIYKKIPFGYGSSSVPVIMDDLQCRGEETDIAACHFRGWGMSNFDYTEAVAITCRKSA